MLSVYDKCKLRILIFRELAYGTFRRFSYGGRNHVDLHVRLERSVHIYALSVHGDNRRFSRLSADNALLAVYGEV